MAKTSQNAFQGNLAIKIAAKSCFGLAPLSLGGQGCDLWQQYKSSPIPQKNHRLGITILKTQFWHSNKSSKAVTEVIPFQKVLVHTIN